jgi:hypothetical protein
VPALGEKVQLLNTAYGVEHRDVTAIVPAAVKVVAVKATQAIGLPNAGVDIILGEDGNPVVLEVNQRSYIGAHSFPSDGEHQGNRVAEAIVDYYFPASIHHERRLHLCYDFSDVLSAMHSSQFATVTLPTVTQDWLVKNITVSTSGQHQLLALFQITTKSAGLMMTHYLDAKATLHLCIAGPRVCYEKFKSIIPPNLKSIGMF